MRKLKKDGETALQFSTDSVQLADKIRVEHGISPIKCVGDGRITPKKYIYAQSEDEINALINPTTKIEE
jgi:hypothetical protein